MFALALNFLPTAWKIKTRENSLKLMRFSSLSHFFFFYHLQCLIMVLLAVTEISI